VGAARRPRHLPRPARLPAHNLVPHPSAAFHHTRTRTRPRRGAEAPDPRAPEGAPDREQHRPPRSSWSSPTVLPRGASARRRAGPRLPVIRSPSARATEAHARAISLRVGAALRGREVFLRRRALGLSFGRGTTRPAVNRRVEPDLDLVGVDGAQDVEQVVRVVSDVEITRCT